jgi:predicted CoA-binding protein
MRRAIGEKTMPTIAIVGASNDRSKFGNKAVRAYQRAGWTVYPIHPSEREIEGIPAYARLSDVPVEQLDRISMYVPAAVGRRLLPDLLAKPAAEVWFNPGSADAELVEEARRAGLPVVEGCSLLAVAGDEEPSA